MSSGRIGYEAYKASTGGKTFNGRDMPTWEQVQERTPHVAKAWNDAAEAMRESRRDDPRLDVQEREANPARERREG